MGVVADVCVLDWKRTERTRERSNEGKIKRSKDQKIEKSNERTSERAKDQKIEKSKDRTSERKTEASYCKIEVKLLHEIMNVFANRKLNIFMRGLRWNGFF